MLVEWIRQRAIAENAELRLMTVSGWPRKEARKLRRKFGVSGLENAIAFVEMGEALDDIEGWLEIGIPPRLLLRLKEERVAGEEGLNHWAAAFLRLAECSMSASEALSAMGVKPSSIGDLGCKNNARSPYLRCAIKPCGPCEGCDYYEKRGV